jgi:ring-1,2-phenylacetyl-CoA epoxidase subunit PaaE
MTFDVPVELASDYRYAAGQHVNVWVPGGDGVRRSYSICSPAGSGILTIAVKRIVDGVFSSYVATELAVGDELDVMTPTGRFSPTLDPTQARHYAAIAAGSGIAPVLSIVMTVLQTEPGSMVTLLYGNRTTTSIMFLDELADIKDRYPDRFQLVHVLSREPSSTQLLSGRLDASGIDRILSALLPAKNVHEWYLCGPEQMITTARSVLATRGVTPARVHAELYYVGAPSPSSEARQPQAELSSRPLSNITAHLDGRRATVVLDDSDETVLEAVLRVRQDAPFACRGGMCGTCRAKVLSGRVVMDRTYALEDDEIAAGYVLTCQSHPITSTLDVDYDT